MNLLIYECSERYVGVVKIFLWNRFWLDRKRQRSTVYCNRENCSGKEKDFNAKTESSMSRRMTGQMTVVACRWWTFWFNGTDGYLLTSKVNGGRSLLINSFVGCNCMHFRSALLQRRIIEEPAKTAHLNMNVHQMNKVDISVSNFVTSAH